MAKIDCTIHNEGDDVRGNVSPRFTTFAMNGQVGVTKTHVNKPHDISLIGKRLQR